MLLEECESHMHLTCKAGDSMHNAQLEQERMGPWRGLPAHLTPPTPLQTQCTALASDELGGFLPHQVVLLLTLSQGH